MKSVLISIQPRWCHKIIDGEKTIEVRKSKPKLDTPFKVYIYCSAGSYEWNRDPWTTAYFTPTGECTNMSQTVIGEFWCDEVYTYIADDFVGAENADGTIRMEPIDGDFAYWIPNEKGTCMEYDEILKYGNGKTLYGWHISDLKIYDNPKELNEFFRECEKQTCEDCPHLYIENTPSCYETWCEVDEKIPIMRPPQSWCYVEELRND